jgi:hypothetical protein
MASVLVELLLRDLVISMALNLLVFGMLLRNSTVVKLKNKKKLSRTLRSSFKQSSMRTRSNLVVTITMPNCVSYVPFGSSKSKHQFLVG